MRMTFWNTLALVAMLAVADSAFATCGSRPTSCPFGGCNSVDWILNGTLSDGTCEWTLYNATVSSGSEVCGWPSNSYLRFSGTGSSLTYVLASQSFVHNPAYTDDDFYLSFVVDGSGTSGSTYLNVWVWNETNDDWFLATTIDGSDGVIYCSNRFIPFYNTNWVGKTLRVVFEGYVNNTAEWNIDYVALDQGE